MLFITPCRSRLVYMNPLLHGPRTSFLRGMVPCNPFRPFNRLLTTTSKARERGSAFTLTMAYQNEAAAVQLT